jgi:hypothetical protein
MGKLIFRFPRSEPPEKQLGTLLENQPESARHAVEEEARQVVEVKL